jgi:hypothetical protein
MDRKMPLYGCGAHMILLTFILLWLSQYIMGGFFVGRLSD